MEIETRHLRVVKAIADAGSISGAAPSLGSTQPALTRQLQRVENEIGGELFVRSRDGVEPTELGRMVVGRAGAVLSVLDSLQSDLADATALDSPAQVRIGVRTGPVLLGLMSGLRAVLPAAEIVTDSEGRIGGLIDLLTTGMIDIAVIREFDGFEIPLDQRILSTMIDTEEVVLAISDAHPMAGLEEIHLADLADERWLLSPLDVDREAECVSQVCAEAGFSPQIVHYVNDDLGFALVRTREAISHSLPRTPPSGTVLRPLVGSPIRVHHLLLIDRNSPFVEHADKLAAFVADAISDARVQYSATAE